MEIKKIITEHKVIVDTHPFRIEKILCLDRIMYLYAVLFQGYIRDLSVS